MSFSRFVDTDSVLKLKFSSMKSLSCLMFFTCTVPMSGTEHKLSVTMLTWAISSSDI